MGGSLYALYPLHLELTRNGYISQWVETAELIHFQSSALGPDTLVIAVSQSGRSAEMVSLLGQGGSGATIIGVSNTQDSPLAQKSHVSVLMSAGEESSVSCKTYLATLVTLRWLAARLIGNATVDADLANAAALVRQYLAGWRTHVEALTDRLRPVKQMFLAGRGDSLATALTGGLILKESAHFPAEGMSSAAFRHGPFETIAPSILVVVFTGGDRLADRNRKLAADIREAGGDAELVGHDSAQDVFRLPPAPESVRPVLEILPVQMISLALAANQGREAGRFERASKVTDVE
jgi:glucosamine--fructose-6-phosphate aminotransferase (isomerizing)